ncbi:MAG: class IV adenylate cyclase [Gudongella sp.]|jgi:adenylate cyclase class 2|nr:class IV adenylate cyclase [Gudongella sp.]
MNKELEVKILNIIPDEIKEKIVSLGGVLIAKETQTNTLVDSSARPIKSFLDAYLRIRETREHLTGKETCVMTLKKNLPNKHLRENIELNVEIDSSDVMIQILKDLGFDNINVGTKHRTSYSFMGARLDIDIWDEKTYPFPYMEVEVEREEDLEQVLKVLEISENNVSKLSIIELQNQLRGTE